MSKTAGTLNPEQFLGKLLEPSLWELLNGLGMMASRRIVQTLLEEGTGALAPAPVLQRRDQMILRNAGALGVDISGQKGRRFLKKHLACEYARQADDLIIIKGTVEMQLKWWEETLTVSGLHHAENLAQQEQPVVCMGAHFGPMSYYIPILAYLLSKKGLKTEIAAVINAPSNANQLEILKMQTERFRPFHKCELDYLVKQSGQDVPFAHQIDKALERQAWVTTQVDVVTGGSSQNTVTFSGQKMRLPGVWGAVRLARRHEAPILPIRMARKKNGTFRFEVLEPISSDLSEEELVGEVVSKIENWFRREPADWGILPRVHQLFSE